MHMCNMNHSYARHDSFIRAAWLIHMCDMSHSYVRHDLFICATWLIRMCDMTRSYVRHDWFICSTWLMYLCETMDLVGSSWPARVHACDMTHSCVRCDYFTWATWFTYATRINSICDKTHLYVRHDSLVFVRHEGLSKWYPTSARHDVFTYATWLIHLSDMTHVCVWHDSWFVRRGSCMFVIWMYDRFAHVHMHMHGSLYVYKYIHMYTMYTQQAHMIWYVRHNWILHMYKCISMYPSMFTHIDKSIPNKPMS